MDIRISICPTSLEFANRDRYDEDALLAALREHIEASYPAATISCLQIGHRQGHAWATIDGDSEAGEALLAAFFEQHADDEELFVHEPATVTVLLGHRSSIAGARWCRPVGWTPSNQIDGADWHDDGAWLSEDSEEAGLVVLGHDGSEGETVTVGLDDLRVASSGDCRVIGPVEIDFA